MATKRVLISGHSLAAYLWDFGNNAGHATYGSQVARWLQFSTVFVDPSLDQQAGEPAPNGHYGCAGHVGLIDQWIANETSGGTDTFLTALHWVGGLDPDGWINAWGGAGGGGLADQLTAAGITDLDGAIIQCYIPYSTNADVSAFAGKVDTIHNDLLTWTGRSASNFKFIVPLDGGYPAGIDASAIAIRKALYNKSLQTGCYFGGSQVDIPNGGDQHYSQPAGAQRAGRRFGHSLAYAFGYSNVSPYGPDITGAYWLVGDDEIHVQVRHRGGSALLNGQGQSSATVTNSSLHFQVTTSGGKTISQQALVSGEIIITMSGNRSVGETASLTYGAKSYWENNHSNNNDIFDDRSDVLGDTIGRPLLPTFDPVTVDFSLGVPLIMHHYKQQAAV